MSTSLTPQAASTAFDPKAVVQSLVDLLKEEPGIDSKYYEGIAKLKDDPDFERVTREFDEAVSGQRNMINIGKDLPEVQQAESQTILDVGLRGEVITGETSDKENDLIRYSTYISGAGSTFGGTMAAFPQTIKDLTEGLMGLDVVFS
ncbi:hypothetical protein AC249_AIPGENE24742 [Exaiptasia diaphana]|nr:hypothetical protein AC249_AIPGENE24742 [Exaiptasia diaphana]